jgi:triacylglycerol lipase
MPPRLLRAVLAPALFLSCALQAASAANNDPIVLVHGFLGFGPEQYTSTGFRYWGGFDDIVGHMRKQQGRHQVWAASVGAISSNWDRAAELYYQIKGGCVDYGSSHTASAARFGALRQPAGKCWAADPADNPQGYPAALYPAWDARHPIHLIGHSQGGQTIRALIELLENGSPNGDEGGAELYKGGKQGWVTSATTISSPNDGTSLRDAMGGTGTALTQLATGIAALANAGNTAAPGHDYGLDHFGLRGGARETAAAYLERVMAAPFWDQGNFDSAQAEMTPDGARSFNAWAKTSPFVYYFSMSNEATEAGSPCCNSTDRLLYPLQNPAYQYPRADMAALTRPYAGEWVIPSAGLHGMGAYTQSGPGRVRVDHAWFANDGVVNTVSMRAPGGHPVRDYSGTPLRGSWNYLRNYKGYDHFDMVGWPRSGPRVYPLYDAVAAILYGL